VQQSVELERSCVTESSAYFIQDEETRREILVFGDVEPDSISLRPRNLAVWQEAAPKIVAGTLSAIFIECSYDNSQSNDRLFGHLKPIFVAEEMGVLAREVEAVRRNSRKRKRGGVADEDEPRRGSVRQFSGPEDAISPKTVRSPRTSIEAYNIHEQSETPHVATPTGLLTLKDKDGNSTPGARCPLCGLKVVIIHVKDRLSDVAPTSEVILKELLDHESELQLGCEFVIAYKGQSIYL
jgi:cAMP phosphodiesterase